MEGPGEGGAPPHDRRLHRDNSSAVSFSPPPGGRYEAVAKKQPRDSASARHGLEVSAARSNDTLSQKSIS
jgi:hypothetical protein